MPGQRNIDDFASADKPIPVHDFAEALRSQAISAGHSDTIQGIDDKRIVQNFIKNIAPGMPKWKPLVDAKSLSFEMAAESAAPPAPSGPPTAASTSATPAAPTGTTPPPKAPAEPGLDERLKAKAEGPPSVGGVAAAAVRPLLHPFTNPLETLGFGSMKSYEQTKHAEKRAQVGVEGQAPPKTTEELYKNYPNLIEPGNIDLLNRPVVKNKDGTSSTVSTMTIDEDGRGILLPTVINGKHVSDGEAREHYQQTGEHMGIFKTEQDADEFDKSLHNRMGWKGPKGSDQQKWQDSSGAPVSKSERFADQAMEEIAGLGDAIVSPVGLITAGFGPEIRAAAKSKGAGWIIRKLGVAEKLTRLGFGGLQLANAVHAMTEFYEDPTPENAAKAIADSGIGALAVAPEAIGVGKAVGRTAKGAAEIAGNITKPGRLGAAVKAGAEGFKRGAAGEPEAPEPTGPPRKAATPTGPPKADSDENYILDEHGNRVQTKGTEAPGDEKTDEDAIAKIIEGVAKKHGATVTRGTLPLDSASTRKPTVPAPKAEKSDLVTRTREVKATKPERLEKTEERGPELPKAISGAKPRYLSHELDFDSDVDLAAYVAAQEKKSASDAEFVKFVAKETGLTEPQVRMQGRKIKGFLGEQSKAQKGKGVINVPRQIDFAELRKINKIGAAKPATATTAAATTKTPAKVATRVAPVEPKKEVATTPTNPQVNNVAELIKAGKLDEATAAIQKAWGVGPKEAAKRVQSAKAAQDKRAAAEAAKPQPSSQQTGGREPLKPPIKAGTGPPGQPVGRRIASEPPLATSGPRPAAATKISSELESEIRQVLVEDGPEEATKQLRIKGKIDLTQAREMVKGFNAERIAQLPARASEPTGPPASKIEVPREQIATRAADSVIEKVSGPAWETKFPLTLTLQDAMGAGGKPIGEAITVDSAADLDTAKELISDAIKNDPNVKAVKYEGGGQKGWDNVEGHRGDIIKENQGREPGEFVPNGNSKKK